MSGAVRVGENVVGALNAPQCPPGPLKLLDQFFAVHVCTIHTFNVYNTHRKTILPRARCCAGLFISPPATEGPRTGQRAGLGSSSPGGVQ